MKVQISFKIVNEEYSQEYADQYDFGKEGIDNRKYHFSKTLEVENVKEFSKIDDGQLGLKTEMKNGVKTTLKIENICIARVQTNDGEILNFGVSKSILEKTHEAFNAKEGVRRFYYYIKDDNRTFEPINGVFLNEDEMPLENLNK